MIGKIQREVIDLKVDIFTTDKKYSVIYADPPWEYRQSGGKKDLGGWLKLIMIP